MRLRDSAPRTEATTTFTDVFLHGGLACMVGGSGPPLIVLHGLSAEHRHPTGLDRSMRLGMVRSLAQRFRVHVVGLPPHPPSTTTMQESATAMTVSLGHEFTGLVAVEGVPTGGSVALRRRSPPPGSDRPSLPTTERLRGHRRTPAFAACGVGRRNPLLVVAGLASASGRSLAALTGPGFSTTVAIRSAEVVLEEEHVHEPREDIEARHHRWPAPSPPRPPDRIHAGFAGHPARLG